MTKCLILSYIVAIFTFSLELRAGSYVIVTKKIGEAVIPFVQNSQTDGTGLQIKPSFSEIEKQAPLQSATLIQIKPADLRGLSMEEFNQIYARISAGPMPLGDYNGYVLQKPPAFAALKKRILRQTLVFPKFAEIAKFICQREAEDCFLEFIWKGKRFWPANELDQIMTKTIFNPVTATSKFSLDLFKSKFLEKVFDFGENIVNGMVTLFPMNTYCGISQVDTRRESIITDANFGDDFGLPSYVGLRDDVVSRKGLGITEEYRMLRPGLYIGKVYTDKVFLFNVVLEKTGTIEDSQSMKPVTRCR